MQNLKSYFVLVFIAFSLHSIAQQPTIGTLRMDAGAFEGYTFFSPFSGTKAWMVDHCGRLINEWDRGTKPGLSAYFLENGLMFRTFKPSLQGPFTSASNAGGLELVDWDNNTAWSYQINTQTQLSHHDAVFMPNGNILVLTWELVYRDELIEMGRDPNEIAQEGYMWSEKILELEPVGTNDANIIWQWEIRDHYVQDFDASKLNYGVVADHPELFNINLPELNSPNSNSTRDWNHFNAIDYHPDLDQILISVRNSDEIWILDHSTTTEEAATHEGGRYGKGGDILYRWGNASAYERATVSDQKLFGQHGVHWIKDGLEDAGKIIIFNNGNGRPGPDYSTVEVLSPPQDSAGGYILQDEAAFGPEVPDWVYGDQSGERFYSAYLSNPQRLPNGNTLVNAGTPGYVFEINPDREVLWEYIIPLYGDFPATQGQGVSNNSSFRAYKYAPDYPGLVGKDLTPGSTIEQGENPLGCILTVANEEVDPVKFEVLHYPASQMLECRFSESSSGIISVFDMLGHTVLQQKVGNGDHFVKLPKLPAGIYLVQFRDQLGRYFSKKIAAK